MLDFLLLMTPIFSYYVLQPLYQVALEINRLLTLDFHYYQLGQPSSLSTNPFLDIFNNHKYLNNSHSGLLFLE